MELRPDASHKENVPPRPAVPLRPEQRRFLKSPGVSLGSGHGQWVLASQAQRGGPAITPSPGAVLCQKPCRVQTNLAGQPSPDLSPVLKGTAGQLMNASLQQQSNLQPPAGTPQGRAREFAIQQSNLSKRGTSSAQGRSPISHHLWPHLTPQGRPRPQGSLACPWSSLRQSQLLATDIPGPDVQPDAGFGPFSGHTRPGSRPWCGLGSWPSGLRGKPLTLEDLTIPVQSQAQTPSQTAIRQLLASVRHLERAVNHLRCQVCQEPSNGQGDLQAKPLRQGENFSLGLTYSSGQRGAPRLPQGAGSKEARLCSSAGSWAAWGVPPRREGGELTPQEQVRKEEESVASCPQDTAPARIIVQKKARNVLSLESETACWQWLSRCFRAWWHLVQKRRAEAAAVALGHQQLLRRGLWALRRAPRLRGAQLEVAWRQHTQALLAQSFQKWRNRTLQQKQGQPHVQTGPGPPLSGAGQGQGPSGREPVADPIRRSSPGSSREEAGAWPRPAGGDGVEQMLQVLQQLAVFLLWFHLKEWAWQERGVQREASQVALRTQRRGRPPLAPCSPVTCAPRGASPDPEQRRAWLGRCFGAWQKFMLRAARYRDRLARRRAGTLRLCLQQWMWMKQLRASDGAKVTQLSLCRQKAGNTALCSSAPGGATAQGLGVMAQVQGLPPEQGGGSLQEACKRLALHRVLLLWRTRLSQRQRADSFLQGMRRQVIRRILRGWHLKVWGPSTPSDSARTTLAPELLGSILGGEPLLDGSPPRSSLEKASRTPALLETLPLRLLWASGQRQRAQCLLPWQVRAQHSQGTARWHRSTLQRRILLSWSHWATAQGAQRELAVAWAWDRSCRAALGLWRRRLVQGREVEQWVRARDRTRVRGALHHWHSCWQRQQSLRARCQTWVQVHLQALRGSVFQDWRQAAAHWRHPGPSPEPCLLHRILEAWAQSAARARDQRAAITQFQQAGSRRLLWTHWAQWQAALLSMRLEPQGKAPEAHAVDLGQWPTVASRGRLLALTPTPALWKQAHGYGTLTGPSQHHNHGGQRKPIKVYWAQSKGTSPWGQTSPRPGNRLPATRLILFRYRFSFLSRRQRAPPLPCLPAPMATAWLRGPGPGPAPYETGRRPLL
ncbi:uncharacterized protein C1orf167-like isoform X2 [Lutra lutra]|uniref:uncharacterized protein C1orf167-like isoform X2 n=1 Tax=Lutra lutra TaxID=9657 RepID=UPI001FD02D5E|nr:uncharacterized protein C1orf167-like isoform X2 [Lutra lutra]